MTLHEQFQLTSTPRDLDELAAAARMRGTRVRRRRGTLAVAVAVVASCGAAAVAVTTSSGSGGAQQLAVSSPGPTVPPVAPFDRSTPVQAVEQALGITLEGPNVATGDQALAMDYVGSQVSFGATREFGPVDCPAPGATAEDDECAQEVLADGSRLITYERDRGLNDEDLFRRAEAQVIRPDGWLVDLTVWNTWALPSGEIHRATSPTLPLTMAQVREAVLALAPSYRP